MLFDSRPIGIFDSGVGGLSILKAMINRMPDEHFVYLADTSFAPYGEKEVSEVQRRSVTIVDFLLNHHNVKSIVIACNTATAAAIDLIRSQYPSLPIVGVEPAIKPAIKKSKTGNIAVIGTRNTLTSNRFHVLKQSLLSEKSVQFIIQPCDGLALAVEDSYSKPDFSKNSLSDTTDRVFKLCDLYLNSMGVFGSSPGMIDTLVLGCTHYIFALPSIRKIVGDDVSIIENGIPVAEQVERVLADVRNDGKSINDELRLLIYTTGKLSCIKVIVDNMSIDAKKIFRHIVI